MASIYTYPIFNELYAKIVHRYQGVIKAQLFGHTHFDHFQSIVYKGEIVGSNIMSPSMTTYGKHNPSYREYLFDSAYSLVDYNQYRVDIRNLRGIPKWEKYYSFKQLHRIPLDEPIIPQMLGRINSYLLSNESAMNEALKRFLDDNVISKWERMFIKCTFFNASSAMEIIYCASAHVSIRLSLIHI